MQLNATLTEQCAQRGIVRIQRDFRWAIALCALINCWICRFYMNADGVSYLDLGDQYWKGNWQVALNPYWSPFYGWLTGLLFRVTKPTMRWEYPEVHLLNFAILIATLFCFEFFWRELLAWRSDNAWTGTARPYIWALGYLLFAYVHLVLHSPLDDYPPLSLVTPDLIVAALIYVASGMMLRFAAGKMGTRQAALMGVTLGIGYLAKSAMLPFAVVVMTTMLLVAWKQNGKKMLIGATLLGFVIISLPFITALSWNEHRVTFGDSGKLNYAWGTNGVHPMHRHWQGDRPGHADALHPTRKIFIWPEVYEFATPVAGTYPVWYDPSYWYAGVDSSLHPMRQIITFGQNTGRIAQFVLIQTGFLTAVLLLTFLLSDRIKESWRTLVGFWPILVPTVAVFLMYAMVWHSSRPWDPRYFSGVIVVGWGAVMASTSISGEEWRRKVLRAASLVLSAMVVFSALMMLIKSHRDSAPAVEQVVVAEQLRLMGVKPDDHVAVIGSAMGEQCWARLEKVKIVSEVPRPDNLELGDSSIAFWSSDREGKQTVLNILKNTGAAAVIADKAPRVLPSGWVLVGNTGHAVYFFQ